MINFTMTMYYPLMMYNIHKTLIDEHIDEIVDYEMTDPQRVVRKNGNLKNYKYECTYINCM